MHNATGHVDDDRSGPQRPQCSRVDLGPASRRRLPILAMIPMAIELGEGGETNAPLARAGIGGLTVSTALTLLLTPMLYTLFKQWRPRNSGERSLVRTFFHMGPADSQPRD